MKQPPWTLRMPLRCFFSTRNAQRTRPSLSIRCQNGPLLDSNESRLQVLHPANSPSVATTISGRGGAGVGETIFTGLNSLDWLRKVLNPIHPPCANVAPQRFPVILDHSVIQYDREAP